MSASATTAILVRQVGRVQVISYNRPERRNAWSVTCVRETLAAIRQANAEIGDADEIMRNENAAFIELLKASRREKPL